MRVFASLFLCTICFSASAAEPAARILISTPEVAISDKDVLHYIEERRGAGHSTDILKTSRGISQSAENLLSLRLLGARAQAAGVKLDDQMQWELDLYRDRLFYRAWVNNLVDRELKATDWDKVAREEFAANPERYARIQPEQVSASHILVNFTGRSDDAALSRIKEIQKRLDAGENFNALAEEYSDDPSVANNKGDLGYFSKGRMVAEFEEQAFSMTTEKEVSEPVKTRFGYHLIKYQGRKEEKKLDFEDVKADIIASQQAGIRKVVQDRLTSEARSVSDAKVNEDVLKSLFESQASKN